MAKRGLLSVVTNLDGLPRVGGLDVSGVPSSGSVEAAGALRQAARGASDQMAQISSQIGNLADRAAVREGTAAGTPAGMDLEFRPRNDGTIYGEAFDRAALQTYEAKVRIEVENDIETGGDLNAKKNAWLSRVPDELKPDIELKFRSGQLTAARKAAREAAELAENEARATLLAEADTQLKTIHQRAFQLGLDAQADDVLSGEIAILKKSLQRNGPDGKPLSDPVQVEKLVRSATEQVADARLLGAFERLPTVEDKKRLLDTLEEDFKNSSGLAKVYDLQGFERIRGQLSAEMNRAESERRIGSKMLLDDLKDLKKFAEAGDLPTPDQMAGLKARVAASPDPEVAQNLVLLEDLTSFMVEARPSTPAQLRSYVADVQKKIDAGGPNEYLVARKELAEKLADKAATELKTNAIGWANRVGVIRAQDLDFSDAAKARDGMRLRLAQREEVSRHFGIDAPVLQPEEKRRLAVLASKGGNETLQIATTIAAAAGENAPRILSEIFEEAPVAGMIGGLTAAVGLTPAAEDAAAGLALKKIEGFKSRGPKPNELRGAATEALGTALSALPKSQSAAIETANMIYEARAQRYGWAEFDAEKWKGALSEALGARVVGDVQYGGLATVNNGIVMRDMLGRVMFQSAGGYGQTVVVPPDVKTDGIGDLIASVKIEDLPVEDRPFLDGGKPASRADLARATIKNAGTGQYFLSLGDPDGETPDWLVDADGDKYVLDLEALKPVLKGRRPDLYLGGE